MNVDEAVGIVLFAHGARDPLWAAPFEAVAARLRAQAPHAQVRLAFLERMTPDLDTAVGELAALGVRDVAVLPMFLAAGAHVRADLPQRIDALRARHPGLRLHLHGPVGEAPAVIDAMAATALRALPAAAPRSDNRRP